MAGRAQELRYAVDLDAAGELTDEHGLSLDPVDSSPEHLLLAALIRCSVKSLRYHAERRGVVVRSASGGARTLVTKRESDDRYALVETELELALDLELEPGPDELAELLGLAERDCFVGSSLTAKPTYRWFVNGRTIA
jgi:uncharacterized OsmC-like protein